MSVSLLGFPRHMLGGTATTKYGFSIVIPQLHGQSIEGQFKVDCTFCVTYIHYLKFDNLQKTKYLYSMSKSKLIISRIINVIYSFILSLFEPLLLIPKVLHSVQNRGMCDGSHFKMMFCEQILLRFLFVVNKVDKNIIKIIHSVSVIIKSNKSYTCKKQNNKP